MSHLKGTATSTLEKARFAGDDALVDSELSAITRANDEVGVTAGRIKRWEHARGVAGGGRHVGDLVFGVVLSKLGCAIESEVEVCSTNDTSATGSTRIFALQRETQAGVDIHSSDLII